MVAMEVHTSRKNQSYWPFSVTTRVVLFLAVTASWLMSPLERAAS